MRPTPPQTIGPYFGHALPHPAGGRIAPIGHPDTVTVHGRVLDGSGAPVDDALLEFWQPAPDGSRTGAPGSLRRDPVNGTAVDRDGEAFTGFGRVATGADGGYAVRTLRPGGVPYLSVCVFARGLLNHLFTRAYLSEAVDPLLSSLDARRRATLIAVPERTGVYRFDVRLRGDREHEETVFLTFR
jgi:protocatechuate 3,4-dioxygenase alpha subunit